MVYDMSRDSFSGGNANFVLDYGYAGVSPAAAASGTLVYP